MILKITTFLLLLTCAATARENISIDSIPKDRLEIHTTPSGNIYAFYHVKDDEYMLLWGNDTNNLRLYGNSIQDAFDFPDPPNVRKPHFEDENDKYLVLRYGCGSPCWVGIFLPFDKEIKPTVIYYYFDYDINNELVCYLDFSNPKTMITVENLKTSEKQSFPAEFRCDAVSLTSCVDSLSIKNGYLYYRWNPIGPDKSEIMFEKKISLKK